MTNLSLGDAGRRLTYANGFAGFPLAHAVSVPGQTGAANTAAVAIYTTQATLGSAARGRLANENAAGRIGSAELAAARRAIVEATAYGTLDGFTGATRPGRRLAACAGSAALREDTRARAAVFGIAADIPRLNAPGRRDVAESVFAVL